MSSRKQLSSARHLRPRDGAQHPTTSVELLFDLVYALAVTQISHLVIRHDISLQSVSQAGFLLLVVWWAWIYTTWMVNWFDPASGLVRLVLVLCGLASLMMAAALPRAFGHSGLLFAGAYVALQVGRNAAGTLLLDREHGLRGTFDHILAWSVLSGMLWIIGALAAPTERLAFWGPALGVDLIAPAFGYWLPRLGRVRTEDWEIEGGHFADRFQAFVIIVLGESIAVTGATAAAGRLRGEALIALAVAFLETGALWWLYFGEVAEHSRRELAESADPGRLARDAYTYLHLPIIAGVIMCAVANDSLISDPGHRLAAAKVVMLVGGPAIYLAGETLFRLRMIGSVSVRRVVAVVALVALSAIGALVSCLVLAVSVLAILTTLALVEYAPRRSDLRSRPAATTASA